MSNASEKKGDDQGGHTVTVMINGQEHVVEAKELSFAQIVALAGLPAGPNMVYTVTYRRGQGEKPEGSLVEGATVKVKNRMVFNATATDKS